MLRYRNRLTSGFSERVMTASALWGIHYISIAFQYLTHSSNRRSFDKAHILVNSLSHFDIVNTSCLYYIWCRIWCQCFLSKEIYMTVFIIKYVQTNHFFSAPIFTLNHILIFSKAIVHKNSFRVFILRHNKCFYGLNPYIVT